MMLSLTLSVLAASLSATDDDPEVRIANALEQLEERWLLGEFVPTAEAAVEALDLIEASACPWREDALTVAMIGGITGEAASTAAEPGYMFWVASQLNAHFDILPEALNTLAQSQSVSPGSNIRLDEVFIGSAYRNSHPQASCPEAQLDPAILFAEPEATDHVYIAFRFPNRSTRRGRSPNGYLYAFPLSEGQPIAERIIEAGDWRSLEGEVEVLTLSPCAQYGGRDNLRVQICRRPPPAQPQP